MTAGTAEAPRSGAGLAAAVLAGGTVSGALAEPHLIHGHRIDVPASVGGHLASRGDLITDVLHHADQAMYTVERTRRTRGPRD